MHFSHSKRNFIDSHFHNIIITLIYDKKCHLNTDTHYLNDIFVILPQAKMWTNFNNFQPCIELVHIMSKTSQHLLFSWPNRSTIHINSLRSPRLATWSRSQWSEHSDVHMLAILPDVYKPGFIHTFEQRGWKHRDPFLFVAHFLRLSQSPLTVLWWSHCLFQPGQPWQSSTY